MAIRCARSCSTTWCTATSSLDDPNGAGLRLRARLRRADHLLRRPNHKELDTLFIGGGGYTFPKYLEAVYPQASIDVMEIDPAVTEAAHTFLNLPRDTRIRSFNEDARSFLLGWADPKRTISSTATPSTTFRCRII